MQAFEPSSSPTASADTDTSPDTGTGTGNGNRPDADTPALRLALPKGRMQEQVFHLLQQAGLPVRAGGRSYRPKIDLPGLETKLLKPQNIVEMLEQGSRDLGFTGRDWVLELDGDLVELLDTGFDPVRLVAAAPRQLLTDGKLPRRPLRVASEYERLARDWIGSRDLNATFVRSYGATEVFCPEDADVILDNTATGSTLEANGLDIVDEVLCSSTRLYASQQAMADPQKRARIESFVLLVQSVLEARRRVVVEVNVGGEQLAGLVEVLPCMREPTIAQLFGSSGYAVKAAVPRDQLAQLIPLIRARGGTDVLVTEPTQILP